MPLDAHTEELTRLREQLAHAKQELQRARSGQGCIEQTRLQRSEWLRGELEQIAHVGSWVVSLDDRSSVQWSDELRRMLGVAADAPASMERFVECVAEEDRPRIAALTQAAALDPAATLREECRLQPADGGAARQVVCVARVVEREQAGERIIVGVVQDITDMRALEQQLAHRARMEALGQLTAGVVHDFNNLLAAIVANVELLRVRRDDDELEQVSQAVDSAASLTRQMLTFARQGKAVPTTVVTEPLLDNAVVLARRVVPTGVAVHLEGASEAWPVRADAAQVQTCILNLVANARDAMPLGGELHIRARNVEVEAARTHALTGLVLQPGPYVAVSVSDTGSGIDPSQLGHIFEPFFTTKPSGEGTGLGLASVLAYLQTAGGYLEVVSGSAGSTFEMYLPRALHGATRSARAGTAVGPTGQRLLLVEDNPSIRGALTRILENAGYRVQAVGSAERAEQCFEQEHPFDLLLSDVLLPGKNGRQLASVQRQRQPELAILLMSGYDQPEVASVCAEPLLHKPFSSERLLEAVEGALHSAHQH